MRIPGFLFAATALTGCLGQVGELPAPIQDGSGVVSVLQEVGRNPDLEEFNNRVSSIRDPNGAETAFDYFAKYVEARRSLAPGLRIQSLAEQRFVGPLIAKEAALRNGRQTLGLSEGLTAETVMEILNSSSDGVHSRPVDMDEIQFAKAVAKELVPSLAIREESFTPLEATVVAYGMRTGDDGVASPEFLAPIEPTEFDAFVAKLGEAIQ